MKDIPECLSRRYEALDEFIKELNTLKKNPNMEYSSDPSIRLLCDFWQILKEDPDVNLSNAVQQRMCVSTNRSGLFGTKHINCYMAGCCKKNDDKKQENVDKAKTVCGKPSSDSSDKPKCRVAKSATPSAPAEELPLNKVLCNLKEAASYEKKCQAKVNELLQNQTQLQEQIQVLEQREKEGVQLLKQADCMWSSMEETYKKKIGESSERQKELLKQLKQVEASNTKWRKNKKDLEFQMDNINSCHQEISEKIIQKTSDIKCIDMEIDDLKKRIENNRKDLEGVTKSFSTKKQASDTRTGKIAKEVTRLENVLSEEQKHKKSKEQEGTKYVKETREDLQKLSTVLLQKKLENENLIAEEEALRLEVELLNQNYDQCKDKCKNKEESISEEIIAIDKEIADFKVKCIRCHECNGTEDVRKFCTDCPRCVNDRDCLYEGDHCSHDNSLDCVCTTVKQKFLDNVFDNMYTLLERQIKSGPGKAVADVVLKCLKKSRNGKLNSETRKILQDFILTTVKKNLNLTIVGGAVKTRCEMDAETYKQLMLCLNQIKVTKPVKVDQGTESKKEPCRRWGGTSECNCPKGPKECVCTKRAQQPSAEPTSCPQKTEEKEDRGEVVACPYKETTACGPDCAMHELPSLVDSEVASWRPAPCQGPTCQFKNMRAAQCVLGPEALSTSSPKILGNEVPHNCEHSSTDPYVCYKDIRCPPRERIIEEVLGRYTDVTPIEKVSYTMISSDSNDDTKQLKAEINNNPTCESEIRPVVAKKLSFVKQTRQTILKKESNIDNTNGEMVLNDQNPIMFKSFSGDLNIALNPKIVQEINKNLDEGTSVYVVLRKTDTGKIVFSLQSDVSVPVDDKLFLPKKSPSGNITLEAYKPINKQLSKVKNKIESDEGKNGKLVNLSRSDNIDKNNLKGLLLNIHKKREKSCTKPNKSMHKVKIMGFKCEKEPIYALKETGSGNFKIILDKEYESFNKKAIKEYKGNDNVEYTNFVRSASGHYIINLNENKDDHQKNALIMKTESGNIKVLLKNSKTDHLSITKDSNMSKSILTANDFHKLLNKSKFTHRANSSANLRRYQIPAVKSNSDSNLYKIEKKDIINRNNDIFNRNIEIKNSENKANATYCNACTYDISCDKSKCNCKNICYKSKQWFWEHSDRETNKSKCGLSAVEMQNPFKSCNLTELYKRKYDVQVLKEPVHPPIQPHGCNSKSIPKESSQCSCDHIPFYNNKLVSSELSEISGPCRKEIAERYSVETYNDSDMIKEVFKNKWASLDYFPPQLPPFLKDFTCA